MGHICSIAKGISGSEAVNESEFSWLEGRNGISHQILTISPVDNMYTCENIEMSSSISTV